VEADTKKKVESALKDITDIYGQEAYNSNEEMSEPDVDVRLKGINLRPMSEHPTAPVEEPKPEKPKKKPAHAVREFLQTDLPPAPPRENKKDLDNYTGVDESAK